MGERRSAIIIGVAIAVFCTLIAAWVFSPSATDRSIPSPETLSVITETAEIQSHISLDHISIATSENYFGHRIRLISGILKNVSERPLRTIDVKMVFTDYDGNPIQESVHEAFEITRRPLEPGEQFRFEIGFENLPRTWNYRVPVVDVVKVSY
jgi:hypothetical protein